jgi:hypothetical protein
MQASTADPSAVAPPRKPRRHWFLWSVLVLLLAAGGVVAYIEGPLWSEISFAADETFLNDEQWESKHIRVDIYNNLMKYSPQRLTRILYGPSERWKGVVCMALRGHTDREPEHWQGVPVTVVRTAVGTKNPGLRKLCLQAFRAVPQFTKADVESVLATLSAHEIPEMGAMVERVAARGGEGAEPVPAVLQDWIKGSSALRRIVAFQTAVRHFPNLDEESASRIRAVFGKDVDEEKPWRLLHVLISRKPEIGDSLLKGSIEDHRLLWQALAIRLDNQKDDDKFLAAAEEAAAKELPDSTGQDRDAIIGFLLNRPNGLNRLFHEIGKRDDAYVEAVFDKLPAASDVVRQRRYEPLGDKEAEAFVALLPKLKDYSRERWGDWMAIAGRPSASARLFPAKAGPTDPKHAAEFARLLADEESALWVQAYFEHVAPPLPKGEVGRLVGLLRKGLKSFAGPPRPQALGPAVMMAAAPVSMGAGPSGRRSAAMSGQAVTTTLFRYAATLRKQYPEHPDVTAFLNEFPRVVEQLGGGGGQRANAPQSARRG